MMLPVLMLIGIGNAPRFWLPVPLILLWPFWALAWIVWLLMRAAGWSYARTFKMALMMGIHCSGLAIDVDSKNESNVHIRLI